MSIRIDTGIVLNTAQSIDNANRNINNEFSNMERSIVNMDYAWNGQAAERAVYNFSKIKQSFYMQRSNVISDMTRFMRQTVVSGYESLENELKSNAKQFK